MRISVKILPAFLLVSLPFLNFSLIGVILSLFVIFVLRQIIVLKPVFSKSSPEENDLLVLESQSISPFVEKVRWCLDYAGFNYREEMDLGSVGILLQGRKVPTLRVPAKNISIQNSSDILRYLYGLSKGRDAAVSRFLEPTEASLELEATLDTLAQEAKALLYPFVFKNPKVGEILPTLLGYQQTDIPGWQKVLFTTIEPLLKLSILKRNNIDAEATAKARQSVEKTFAKIESMLSDGRQYLFGGDRPTFVDFQFAAIGHFCLEENKLFGGRALQDATKIPLRSLVLPEDLKENEALFNNYPAALKFAKRMYEEHRLQKITDLSK